MNDEQILVETLRLLAEARLKGARPARIAFLENEVQRLARKVIAAQPPAATREHGGTAASGRWSRRGPIGIATGTAMSRVRRGAL